MRLRSEPVLDVKDLCISRSGTPILSGVSWRVERGEHWAILGANGSGKTSLLSALTGYLMPTSGTIDLLGCRYGKSDWRGLRRKIGLVSSSIRQMMAETEPAIETVISGKYAEIDLWRRLSRNDRREGREILEQLECSALEERAWMFLSQGERQRVLIGRALMAKPSLLILDEPCAGLDPVAREHFLTWMNRLGARADAPTLILVTHHVEEIMPAFTHALILRAGGSAAAGIKREVLTNKILSGAFGSKVRVLKTRGRYELRVNLAQGDTLVA